MKTTIDFFDDGKRIKAGTPVSELSDRCRGSVIDAGWVTSSDSTPPAKSKPKPPADPKPTPAAEPETVVVAVEGDAVAEVEPVAEVKPPAEVEAPADPAPVETPKPKRSRKR